MTQITHYEFYYFLENFVPKNNDGEVQGFELVPVTGIVEKLCSSDFKAGIQY